MVGLRFRAVLVAVVLIATIAVTALVLTGEDGDEKPQSTASMSPSPSDSPPFDPADRRETAWGTELINIEQPLATGKGRRVQIYFVSGGSHATLLSNARECVDTYLEEYRAAACYAFDSEEALAYADVSANGGMENLCWRAFVSSAREADGAEGIEEGQYEEEGCPDVAGS